MEELLERGTAAGKLGDQGGRAPTCLVYSLSICNIMDYLPKRDLLRLQCLCKYMYETVAPNYFGNRQFRFQVLGQMRLPEVKVQNAVLFFQDDGEGNFYSLNFTSSKWQTAEEIRAMEGEEAEEQVLEGEQAMDN